MAASDSVTPNTDDASPDAHHDAKRASQADLQLDSGWSIELVEPDDRRDCLALLLTGRPTGGQMAVDHFLDFVRLRGMHLDRFWIIRHQNQPDTAVLQVQAPGKAGMLFLSPMTHDRQVQGMAALIRHASLPQNTTGLALLQILLDPHQARERQAAELGGFGLLAQLQYMRRRTHKPTGNALLNELNTHYGLSSPSQTLSISHWLPSRRKLFGDAILASYQDTQDCPGLLGLREIDDIIDGHMGAGTFTPDLWQVIHHGDEPCAVMLMNPLATGSAMELAYLGVCPNWRGKGLANRLMNVGLGEAWEHGAHEMLLAVDEANAPAMALYRTLKFSATARKVALLRAVIKQVV